MNTLEPVEQETPVRCVLEAFALSAQPPELVTAPVEREWMNGGGRHAYRCLPLTIGNTYGWQLLLPVDVSASWNGRPTIGDVTVTCERPFQAVSNFANGILTFDAGWAVWLDASNEAAIVEASSPAILRYAAEVAPATGEVVAIHDTDATAAKRSLLEAALDSMLASA